MKKPLIAIVGRPNVGKSTLFNRLVGEKKAIVLDEPGTTRDRVISEVRIGDKPALLVDTGGLETEPDSELRLKVKKQVEMAINEADIIIFLVDAEQGLVPQDKEIANMLRRTRKPIIPVANKCDNERREAQAMEFYALGLGDVLKISAYHNLGIDALLEKVEELLPETPEAVEAEGIKIAIVGRPNVGKSMLINAILGEERVIVEDKPGTTRDPVDTHINYDGEKFILIDTAGIRRKGRIKPGVERYSILRALRSIERSDISLLLIDASEGITSQDAHIAGYIAEAGKGIIIGVNKWDLVREGEDWWEWEIRRRLSFLAYAPVIFLSAKERWGIEKIFPEAIKIYRERNKFIENGKLKKFLSKIITSHSPPKSLKIYSIRQVGKNPPSFIVRVSDTDVHFSYRRYIENSLRREFGFYGTPLKIVYRRGRR